VKRCVLKEAVYTWRRQNIEVQLFKLGKYFVTATTFKLSCVLRNRTDEQRHFGLSNSLKVKRDMAGSRDYMNYN